MKATKLRKIAQRVEISDSIIDTKSNLNSLQLKRNLYQLGLDYPVVNRQQGDTDRLLGVRNAITHGDSLEKANWPEVKEYTTAAFEIMRFIQDEVYKALREEKYRRPPGERLALSFSRRRR